MQGPDGLREPELLARLRRPRMLLMLLGAGLVWLIADAQRPEAKARGAAAAAAQAVAGRARGLAEQATKRTVQKAD